VVEPFKTIPAFALFLLISASSAVGHGQATEFRIEGTLLSQESSNCSLILDHPFTAVGAFSGALAWDPNEAMYLGAAAGQALAEFEDLGALDFFHLSSCYPGNLNFGLIFWDFNNGVQYWLPDGIDDEVLQVELITALGGGDTFLIATETNFCFGSIGELVVSSPGGFPSYPTPGVFALEVEETVAATVFLRGDFDASSTANIADAVLILNYLYLGGATPPCRDAADCDDNGLINIADPMNLLLRLFTGGPPLPPPFLACGSDPTDDSLDCQEPPGCI